MMLAYIVTVPYWWHSTLLEIVWLIAGLLSLPIAAANVADAKKDEAILDDIKSDKAIHSRHYYMIEEAAKGHTFEYLLSLVTSSLITVTGVIGCAASNPTGGATTVTGFAVTACLIGIACVSATRAWTQMSRRQRLYELAAGRSAVLAAEMRARNVNTPE